MARDIVILMRANPFRGPTPSIGPSNESGRIKIIKSMRHRKTGTFEIFSTYMSFCFCILYSVFCILYLMYCMM
jgi:hypothetical protein